MSCHSDPMKQLQVSCNIASFTVNCLVFQGTRMTGNHFETPTAIQRDSTENSDIVKGAA
jgi:hypothetical protein